MQNILSLSDEICANLSDVETKNDLIASVPELGRLSDSPQLNLSSDAFILKVVDSNHFLIYLIYQFYLLDITKWQLER